MPITQKFCNTKSKCGEFILRYLYSDTFFKIYFADLAGKDLKNSKKNATHLRRDSRLFCHSHNTQEILKLEHFDYSFDFTITKNYIAIKYWTLF